MKYTEKIESNEVAKRQLAKAIMEAAVDRLNALGVRVKVHKWYLVKPNLTYFVIPTCQ